MDAVSDRNSKASVLESRVAIIALLDTVVSSYRYMGLRLGVHGVQYLPVQYIGGSGRTAGRYASAARAFISPTAFEQARGGALGAGGGRVGTSGSLGAASSESAAGSGRLRACSCSCGC